MSISYDPDKCPDVDLKTIRQAREQGLRIVNVICKDFDDAGQTPVNFTLLVETVPRLGERLLLQDEKRCQVVYVLHKIITDPEHGFYTTVVTVVGHMLKRVDE